MIERRAEPRILCADLVEVAWKDTTGRRRRSVANLEDISQSGACIQVDMPIPNGTEVKLSFPRGAYSGVVRYCRYREIGYFIGLEFENGMKWSKRSFRPLHMLDPQTLVNRAANKRIRDASLKKTDIQ